MRAPVFTAFFTKGTLYEREAARLVRSLDKLGLEHDVRGIESRGDWKANAGYTATHIATMQAAYPDRPIVQLDADAVVWLRPEMFDVLPDSGCDLGVHYRKGVELLNGTLWLAPTHGARLAIDRYRDYVARSWPNVSNEQRMLQNALLDLSDLVRVYRLPASYAWIHDVMKDDLAPGDEPVIEHLQASRETHVGPLTAQRRNRLREIAAAEL